VFTASSMLRAALWSACAARGNGSAAIVAPTDGLSRTVPVH
jgi:hypothetical protein